LTLPGAFHASPSSERFFGCVVEARLFSRLAEFTNCWPSPFCFSWSSRCEPRAAWLAPVPNPGIHDRGQLPADGATRSSTARLAHLIPAIAGEVSKHFTIPWFSRLRSKYSARAGALCWRSGNCSAITWIGVLISGLPRWPRAIVWTAAGVDAGRGGHFSQEVSRPPLSFASLRTGMNVIGAEAVAAVGEGALSSARLARLQAPVIARQWEFCLQVGVPILFNSRPSRKCFFSAFPLGPLFSCGFGREYKQARDSAPRLFALWFYPRASSCCSQGGLMARYNWRVTGHATSPPYAYDARTILYRAAMFVLANAETCNSLRQR